MAVSSPNLTIDLTVNDSCSSLLLADLTGVVGVNGNLDGYGSDSVLVNDVTSLVVILTFNKLASNITYTFTLLNGAITACTLTIASGTPADIFAQLTSTVWPFASTLPFNLFGDYGVTLPTFADDIYSASYDITGEHSAEAFTFTAIDNEPVVCNNQYCIDQKFTELDWSCECAAKNSKEALLGQAMINSVVSATRLGNLTAALNSLRNVTTLCENTTAGCGCA